MTRPIPKVYTTRFFQLITTRQFAEAERILERIKQKMHVSERNRGYFQALCGMLLTRKNNNDRYAFLTDLDLGDKKQVRKNRQEFLSHAESRLHGEYDRGFFDAWAEYMRILNKMEIPSTVAVNKTEEEKEGEPEPIDQETKDLPASKEEAPTSKDAEMEQLEAIPESAG